MRAYRAQTAASGLAFPEGPRWRDGRLWFTDQHAAAICSLTAAGRLEVVAETEDLPGGLGWLPDGSLLVVYMTQRRLMRLTDRGLVGYADLSGLASFHCNDMVVDAQGRAYVGNFGFDLHGGAALRNAEIVRVDLDGSAELCSDRVVFPNGSVITPDGDTLLVAETFAHRVTAFALDARGRCVDRRTWAELGAATPDGICLDADGALWVASPGTNELTRYAPGGAVLDRCATVGTPYACMLGGPGRRTLYVCTAETDDPAAAARRKTGRIERVEVATAGVGLP